MSAIDDLARYIKRIAKKTGSDYTGTVTRVEGGTAYVQLTGSAIPDTPVVMSISAKPGDKVRVRISGGRACITGNDTAPPTNDTETIKKARNDLDGLSKRIKKVEDGIKIEGVVHFTDLENPDEETVIKGGNIDATSITIKDSYSMYNLEDTQRVMALNWTEPIPDFGYSTIVIDPDENIPNCYINTDNTWVKAFSAATPGGANLSFDTELFYVDMPVYDSSYEPTTNIMRVLGAAPLYDGSHVNLTSMAVYSRTAGGSANVGVNQYGTIYRVSSSRRYKHDIQDLPLEEAKKLLDLKPRTFKYNDDFLTPDDERVGKDVPGFISEEVSDLLPIAVDHDEDGNCEMWNSNVIVPCLLKLIQDQEKRIATLEAEVKALKENR